MNFKCNIIRFTLVLTFIVVSLLVACSSEESQEEKGMTIIHDFFDSSYEYTSTHYTVDDKGTETVTCVYQGYLVNDPYQQYEVLEEDPHDSTSLTESYSYEENDKIYYAMKLKSGEEEVWLPAYENERQDRLYNRDNLGFTLEDTQTDSNEQIAFSAEYKDVLEYGSSKTIKVPYIISLEFIVDLEKEEVIQINIDNGDSSRAVAVARAIENGNTQTEVEESVKEGTDYIQSGIIVDITKYTSDSPIDNPMM